MKIALLHYTSPSIIGGVESVMRHHALLMQKAGHEVSIVAGRGDPLSEDIPLLRIPLLDSLHETVLEMNEALKLGEIPQEFHQISDELCRQLIDSLGSIDILIAHNVCSLNKNLALTAALKHAIEESSFPHLIIWHHDLAWKADRYLPQLHPFYPWTLLSTDWGERVTYVAVSEMRRQEWMELSGVPMNRIHVIPNGIEMRDFFKLENATIHIIEKTNLMEAFPILFLPVRITTRKNIETALHTLYHLQDSFPNSQLVVTGPPGPHNPQNLDYFQMLLRLRKQLNLSSKVHFLAEIVPELLPDAVIADLYRVVDALFLPSLEEGFGIPILEAGISRLPIFCSDIASLRSLAKEQALYFKPDDNPRLIASMISQFFHENPYLHFPARVRREYTWEGVYKTKISPLLDEVVKK